MTWTKLHEACKHGNVEDIISLAKHSDDCFQTDDHYSTPLHVMCLVNPDSRALIALVEANPKALTDQDVHGDTPVHLLCRHRNQTKQVVEFVIKAATHALAIPNKHGYLPLHVLCTCDPCNSSVIALLVQTNPSALHRQVKMGQLVARRSHKENKPDHRFDPSGGLTSCDSVDLRLMQHNDFERNGCYPLHMAICYGGSVQVIKVLVLGSQAETLLYRDKEGQTPLLVALNYRMDEPDIIEFLVSANAKALHIPDKKGNLPIHVAAVKGANKAIFQSLWKGWPGSVNECDASGSRASDLALSHGLCSIQVTQFLSKHANVEAT